MKVGADVVLTQERQDAGRAILDLTDFAGFDATGAAWVWTKETDHWHFLLVSGMIDTKGPRWVYERLMQVFSKYRLPALVSPLDIKIASPDDLDFANFPRLFPVSEVRAGEPPSTFADLTVNSLGIDYMAVYRFRAPSPASRSKSDAFDHRVRELMAA